MMKSIVVAVDGPAGSGKSSVSREAARRCSLRYLDSGAVYRSITWFVLKSCGCVPEDGSYEAALPELLIEQEYLPDASLCMRVNGTDVSAAIREEIIAKNIGPVSDRTAVRNFVNGLLRTWARTGSVIMDGRDIGSVVFPDADLKIYLDASVEVRAQRRINEYREMGKNLDEKSVAEQIIQRDSQDRSRPFGRLVRAMDAVYIDTTLMTWGEVVDQITAMIKKVNA